MPKSDVTLYYVRLPVAGVGAHGWGPFRTQEDAEAVLADLAGSLTGHNPAALRVDAETYSLDDADAARIVYHSGNVSAGRGRRVVS